MFTVPLILYGNQQDTVKEPLNNSSLNYSETKNKSAILFFSHFQWLTATENGDTSMYRGRSELIRPSLRLKWTTNDREKNKQKFLNLVAKRKYESWQYENRKT